MPDTTGDQPVAEPTQSSNATTTTATDTFKPVTSQEQFDRMVQERIARERQKFADYEELKAKAAKLDELEQQNATELERAQKAAAEAQAAYERLQTEARETRLRAAIIAEAAKPDRKVVDPDAVVSLIDRSALEIDDAGVPTNIAEAMDSLLATKPYLVAQAPTRGSADQGARGGSKNQLTRDDLKSMTSAEIVKAQTEGRLDHLLRGES